MYLPFNKGKKKSVLTQTMPHQRGCGAAHLLLSARPSLSLERRVAPMADHIKVTSPSSEGRSFYTQTHFCWPRVIVLEITWDLVISHKSCRVQWERNIQREVSQCDGLLKAGKFLMVAVGWHFSLENSWTNHRVKL